jgi:FtsP/CotA-like multicopper oxidase with cupredoxin domain
MIMRLCLTLCISAFPLAAQRPHGSPLGLSLGSPSPFPRIQANHNDHPSGSLADGVLNLRLEARLGLWHPEAENGVGIAVQAFAEEGKPLENPGPLIRVPEGTELRVSVRNTIPGKALVVHGLSTRPSGAGDSLVIAPGSVSEARFLAGASGTYFYWATTTGVPIDKRRKVDSQLSGAFIVDPAGAIPSDHVFLIAVWLDSLTVAGKRDEREIPTINGKMFPYTESFTYTVGDTVRWRLINASDREHPMHLHGFFYRVDGRGDAARDTLYEPGERRLGVTELMPSGTTLDASWSPDRPGNWIFHCHILFHVAGDIALSPPKQETHTAGMERMSGLVLALHVRPLPGASYPATTGTPRQLRLVVQSRPNVYRKDPGFGFVLQEGDTPPAPDSIRIPGSPIVVTRGEPVQITVVNHLVEQTAVHWHGIELTSYYDGVPGISGEPGHLLPSIAPSDSFVAAYTPPRAGTFIYHTHIDDVAQMESGLYGPLIVLPPGVSFDPTTDHVVVISIHEYPDTTEILLNGSTHPAPLMFRAGVRNRLRLVTIPSAGSGDVVLLSDTSPVTWRAVAKDGADLPSALATVRPARQYVSVGETYDFEVMPTGPQWLRLELRDGSTVLAVLPVEVRW